MRLLFIIACALLVFAIVAEWIAKGYEGSCGTTMARATAERVRTGTDAGLGEVKANAEHQSRIGGWYTTSSLVLAGLGVILWVVSLFQQHRNRIALPVLLLTIYVAFFY